MKLCVLSVVLVVAACSHGKGGAAANSDVASDVPKEAYDVAKAQVLDVGFKNCGDVWGSVYRKLGPTDFSSNTEYQFKNLRMKIETFPKTLSEADKMNGLQWQGQISLSADVTRERLKGQKQWGNWTDGFGAQNMGLSMREVNGKWSVLGLNYFGLRAACPN